MVGHVACRNIALPKTLKVGVVERDVSCIVVRICGFVPIFMYRFRIYPARKYILFIISTRHFNFMAIGMTQNIWVPIVM